jgi:hypothetical protein
LKALSVKEAPFFDPAQRPLDTAGKGWLVSISTACMVQNDLVVLRSSLWDLFPFGTG